MKPLLFAALAAYVIAAIHSILAFVNKRRALERISLYSVGAGFILHTAALAVDWVQDGHYPLFGLRETLSFLAWTLVATYVLTFYRYRTLALGSFTLPLVSALTFYASIARGNADRTPGALGGEGASWLIPVHATLWIFAYAAFFVVFVASIMYILQERELKLKTFSAIFHRLPSLTTVNDIASSAAALGFTLVTLGIVTGMVRSSSQNGRLWNNDPKEIFAVLTWLLYLLLLLYRSTASWRGRRAAWMGIVGFALVLCTLFGARFMGGYHFFG
jgi:ABC-type uncharacterized transport system permease subunit